MNHIGSSQTTKREITNLKIYDVCIIASIAKNTLFIDFVSQEQGSVRSKFLAVNDIQELQYQMKEHIL